MRRLWPNFLIMLMFWTLTVWGFIIWISQMCKKGVLLKDSLSCLHNRNLWKDAMWNEWWREETHLIILMWVWMWTMFIVQHNTKNGSLLNLFDGTEATILPSTNPFPFPPLPPSPPHPPSPAMAQVNWPLFIFQFTFTIQWTISTQYFFCCGSDFHSLSTFTFLPPPSVTQHSQPLAIAKVLQIW